MFTYYWIIFTQNFVIISRSRSNWRYYPVNQISLLTSSIMLSRVDVGTMFCLPWYLTWYSHTLTHYEHVVRLYDYFLASNPFIPLYLIPAILLHRQDCIFATECELSALHQQLSQVRVNICRFYYFSFFLCNIFFSPVTRRFTI